MVKRATRAGAATEAIDDPPEIDRLDGAPHPRDTTDLHGHDSAQLELAAAFAGGRMHHAWLISGLEGVGKATLAYRFARFALSAAADRRPTATEPLGVTGTAIGARQVRAMSHPLMLVIRREWDQKEKRFPQTISVDDVRRLKTFLSRTVEPGNYRMVIVDRADDLNLSAANALLKSLEEPPPRTMFLLVAGEPGRLLRTIHSRCRTLALLPLAERPLRLAADAAIAAGSGTPIADGDMAALTGLAGGSVRRLLTLHAGGGLSLYRRVLAILVAPRLDSAAVHKLAGDLTGAANEQTFDAFNAILRDLLARLLRHAATGAGGLAGEEALAARYAAGDRLVRLAEAYELIEQRRSAAAALNLDRRTYVVEAVAAIAAA